MVNLFAVMGGSAIVILVMAAVGYFIWLKTRPKKSTWTAKIYQLGEGIRPPIKDKDGKIVSDVKLQDLRFLGYDILEKIERGPGNQILYRLQKLKKITPSPEADTIEYFGDNKRGVDVLLVKDGCTLLKKGYDSVGGQIVFDPLPHSRTNIIKSEMTERKSRLQSEKDILQAIAPFVTAAIIMFGMIAISYVMVSGYIEMSENIKEGYENYAETILTLERMRGGVLPEPKDLGPQTPPVPVIK